MSATIKIFNIGNRCFRHVMDPGRDQVELRDEDNRVLLVFRERTKVFDRERRIGDFAADFGQGAPHWFFYATNAEAPLDFGPDLATARVEMSRMYCEIAHRSAIPAIN